jgi:hypothetical protein
MTRTRSDFRAGSDATGDLVYTNQGTTDDGGLTPQLEYTVRTTCAAVAGDEMFADALIWRHAASLAPALAKDSAAGNIAKFCLAMFERRDRGSGQGLEPREAGRRRRGRAVDPRAR